MHERLFPYLEGKWGRLNLDEKARGFDGSLTDPAVQEEWVRKIHERMGVDYSYGGYMEHRNTLLKDAYNAGVGEDHFWHLGIDYNVPAGKPVHMPVDGELVYSYMDPDTNGGWGGKLIFKCESCYLILGHLNLNRYTNPGLYKMGEVVATVADYPENGNWFPHLHVQCCRTFDPDVDGYSHRYDGMEVDFPNPEDVL